MLAMTLGGCGGGGSGKTTVDQSASTSTTIRHPKPVALGKAAYERTMKRLGTQLARSVEHLFPLVEAQPGTDVSKETVMKLEATRAVVTTVGAKVAAIAPPAPIRAEHQRLIQGISDLGGELDRLIQVEEKGSSQAFGIYARFRSLGRIAKATEAIQKKGYAIA